MKKIFTITLLAFLFFACQSDTTQTPPAEKVDAHAGHDHDDHDDHAGHNHGDHAGHNHSHDEPKHHKASGMSPYIGKWTYYFAIKDSDYYKGRYIEFKGDGTFTSGVNDKETNSGNWTLDEKNSYLDLDYVDNSVDRDEEWKSQKNTSDVIILIGNSPKNTSWNQIKLERVIQQ